eukprot:CAMPEP_0185274548 /NCGR_PEP_ID=MMETSP1359-20130426/52077_1 /TAXON_ID=552665 /ORGANISM="Bigelowiella longifila, Strain CCMP242" /LENGTH=33 /DNA_ID= /DNA_START= /DNA_END= /DNA_ORIENTATION=
MGFEESSSNDDDNDDDDDLMAHFDDSFRCNDIT